MQHGIAISDETQEEMQHFLEAGLPAGEPPSWITWSADDDSDDSHVPPLIDDDSEVTSDGDDDSNDDNHLPFLHLAKNTGGRKCRCGSDTHLTVNSHACPLNPRNVRAGHDDGDVADVVTGHDNDVVDADDNDVADAIAGHDDDVVDAVSGHDDDVALPQRRSRMHVDIVDAPPRRRRRHNYLKANSEVEVLYENNWWPAKIKFKHRGNNGYAIQYHDEEECEEPNVPEVRIRPPQE